jgi:hypothetical protein
VARRRQRNQDKLRAPDVAYHGPDDAVLVLRGAMTPKTRAAYLDVQSGQALAPGADREDAWQRAVEYLFERLTVSWSVAGAEPLSRQKDLLGRFRFATIEERRWIREQLRAHLAEHFPELPAP